jgi:hypothetical protein
MTRPILALVVSDTSGKTSRDLKDNKVSIEHPTSYVDKSGEILCFVNGQGEKITPIILFAIL